jgi:hypothetical protein
MSIPTDVERAQPITAMAVVADLHRAFLIPAHGVGGCTVTARRHPVPNRVHYFACIALGDSFIIHAHEAFVKRKTPAYGTLCAAYRCFFA